MRKVGAWAGCPSLSRKGRDVQAHSMKEVGVLGCAEKEVGCRTYRLFKKFTKFPAKRMDGGGEAGIDEDLLAESWKSWSKGVGKADHAGRGIVAGTYWERKDKN